MEETIVATVCQGMGKNSLSHEQIVRTLLGSLMMKIMKTEINILRLVSAFKNSESERILSNIFWPRSIFKCFKIIWE